MLMVDSGTYDHVCPITFAPHCRIVHEESVQARSANEADLEHHGTRYVPGWLRDSEGQWKKGVIRFEVHNVKRPMLSTGTLKKQGIKTVFADTGDLIVHNDGRFPLVEKGDHSWLPLWLLKMPGSHPLVD